MVKYIYYNIYRRKVFSKEKGDEIMKKVIILVLCSCIFALSFSSSIAMTDNDKKYYTVIIDHSNEQIEQDRKKTLEKLKNSESVSRMDEIVYDWRYVGKTKVTKKGIGYAGNQKSGGTVFTSPGGFYWQDGGYKTSVSFSSNFGYDPVSTSFDVSRGSQQKTGVWISSPYVNKPCKLYI